MMSGRPVLFQRAALSFALVLAVLAMTVFAGCGGKDEDELTFTGKPRGLVPAAAFDSTVVDSASADSAGVVPEEGTSAEGGGLNAVAERPEPVIKEIDTSPAGARVAPAQKVTKAAAAGGPYSLQLGSFTNVDNARRQGDRIRSLGYDPVIEASNLGGQVYHRVMLKGFRDMAEASRLGEKIRSELGIAYLVRRTD